jgi:hypothetical protein
MRKSLLFGALVTTIGLMSCSSQKKLESDPPFTIESPTVAYWAAGREEGGAGMRFAARWNPADPSAVVPDSLYFRGRVLKINREDTETGFAITAEYAEKGPDKPDLIMHGDSLREVGNQPPRALPPARDFPFPLAPDEAVISYRVSPSGEVHYFKITGVVEKKGRIYPGRQGN